MQAPRYGVVSMCVGECHPMAESAGFACTAAAPSCQHLRCLRSGLFYSLKHLRGQTMPIPPLPPSGSGMGAAAVFEFNGALVPAKA